MLIPSDGRSSYGVGGIRDKSWLEKKGEEFMSQHTNNINNAGSFTNMDGIYGLEQLAQDNGQYHNDLVQENIDGWNKTVKRSPYVFNDLIEMYQNGSISATQLQSLVAQYNLWMNPTQEAWLNNILSQEATKADNDFQEEMRDTSLISQYEQLQSLGLNPGSVINLGGASSGVSSQAASVKPSDVTKMQFDRKTQMAKTLIGLAGGLASTGAHGAALGAAKFAASKLTSEASRYATDQKYAHMKTKYFDRKNGFINEYYD